MDVSFKLLRKPHRWVSVYDLLLLKEMNPWLKEVMNFLQ